ncbi:MAG: phosphoglycerate mutase [Betaproteobacteria bacterium]|nr:phosphoglycerate mutase [Betaproteobacteria bacterium]
MQCTLLIPDLWWSPGGSAEAYRDLVVPELQTSLARARRSSFPPLTMEAWLCQAFEVERQTDWPVAPLTLELDGGDPGEAYWLRADPVHLRPYNDQLLLADSSAFSISPDEADALTGSLNGQFAGEGLRFRAPHPERWYLRVDIEPRIATHSPGEVSGRSIRAFLPKGENALRWHHVCNEIQMLFHDHPVNRDREARGEPAINSVWLWGGGRRPLVPGRHFSTLWAADPLASALAARSDIFAAPPPADADHWLTTIRGTIDHDNRHLLVLDDLAQPARRGDLNAWRDGIETLNRKWIAALVAALRQGRLSGLTLTALAAAGCERFELGRSDMRKFWRRTLPLSAYAPGTAP